MKPACGPRALVRRAVGALLVGVLLAGCRAPAPGERFAEALRVTLSRSFGFEVVLEADQSALADLGDQAGGAAALLSGIRLHGIVDGIDTQVALDALGGTVVELRQLAADADGVPVAYLRAGVVDLLAQVGVDEFAAEAQLLDRLVAARAPGPLLTAVVDAFDGRWIGIDGGLGAGFGRAAGLLPAPSPGGSASPRGPAASGPVPAVTAFGTDLQSFLDRFVDVEELDGGILHVELRLASLLRTAAGLGDDLGVGRRVLPDELEDDLASLPGHVPGDVRVVDGVVEELAFDVAEAARALGTDVGGRVVLRIRVVDHGRAGPVVAPEGVVPIDAGSLDEAVVAILRSFGLA